MVTSGPPPWKLWTALGIVYVVWGSTYLAIRYVVESLPPLLSASARFSLAALILITYLLVRRGPGALRATRRQHLNAGGIGLLLLLGGNGGVTVAEQRGLPSGLAALIVAAVPLWVVLLRVLARDRPSRQTLVGVAVGFLGIAVLLRPDSHHGEAGLSSSLIVLGSSLLWSIGSFLSGRVDLPTDPLLGSVSQMVGGALALALVGLALRERFVWDQVQTSSVVAVVYLVVFGSVVAFTAYSWLLRVAPVSKVSTYAYVNPVVAVALGAVFVGETLSASSFAGGALTLVAVAIVVAEEGRRRSRQQLMVAADAPVEAGEIGPQGPDDEQGRARSSAT